MKTILILGLATTLFCSSCATIFGGKLTVCQRERKSHNQPAKKIRPVAFAFDALFFPALIYDFANGAIYKPCNKTRCTYSFAAK